MASITPTLIQEIGSAMNSVAYPATGSATERKLRLI